MSKKQYTAEEAAELLTPVNDRDGNDFEFSFRRRPVIYW